MAQVHDIENAIVERLAGVLPAAIGEARIYRGLPQSVLLKKDLNAGIPHVSVNTEGKADNTSRYIGGRITCSPKQPSLTAEIVPDGVVFGGTGGRGQVVGVVVAGLGVAYRLNADDTPDRVATTLAQRLGGTTRDTGVLVLDQVSAVRVMVDQNVQTEARRERRRFRIAAWCPSPESRDDLVAAIEGAFAPNRFLDTATGDAARLIINGGELADQGDVVGLWRADINAEVEFGIGVTTVMPEMVFGSMAASFGDEVVWLGDRVVASI